MWGSYLNGKYRPGWGWSFIWVSIFAALFSSGKAILVIPAMILAYINYLILERVNTKKAKQLQGEEEKLILQKHDLLNQNK